MILNFSTKDKAGKFTRFIEKYFEGMKIHSIREDKHNRWKQGMMIHITTGSRTKNYECHAETWCDGVQPIQILFYHKGPPGIHIWIEDRKLTMEEMETLALNDGFNDLGEFFNWFCRASNGSLRIKDDVIKLKWVGKIIHWTDLRY